jgi:hypothetical protein
VVWVSECVYLVVFLLLIGVDEHETCVSKVCSELVRQFCERTLVGDAAFACSDHHEQVVGVEFVAKGWEVVICTNQPTEAGRRYTLQFLEDNKIPYDELHFTKSKHLVSGDYLIDDAPEFLTAPAQELESRICIDYPFNQGIPSDLRVKSLTEAVKFLTGSAGEILKCDENKNEV